MRYALDRHQEVNDNTAQWAEIHPHSTSLLGFFESFVEFYELLEISGAQLEQAVRETFKSDEDEKWLKNRLHAVVHTLKASFTLTSVHTEDITYLLEQTLARIGRANSASLWSMICSTGPKVFTISIMMRPLIKDALLQDELIQKICSATGWTLGREYAKDLLEDARAHLSYHIETTVARHVYRSGLGFVSKSGDIDEVNRQMNEQEIPSVLNPVLTDLQQSGDDVTLFTDDIRAMVARQLGHCKEYYTRRVDRAITKGLLRPDTTRTIDDTIRLQLESHSQIYLFPVTWDLIGFDDPQEGWEIGPDDILLAQEFIPEGQEPDVHPQQGFIEMYIRRQYGLYLTQNTQIGLFEPASPDGRGTPQELIDIVIWNVMPDSIDLQAPDTLQNNQWTLRTVCGWGKDFGALCLTSKKMRKSAQIQYMKRARLSLNPSTDGVKQEISEIAWTAGPTKRSIELRYVIPTAMFSHITELDLDLREAQQMRDSTGIYPILDTLTRLKRVDIRLPADLRTPPWSQKGLVEGWFMKLLGRIKPAVELRIYFFEKRQPVLRQIWEQTTPVQQRVVFEAWVHVVQEAFRFDRRGEEPHHDTDLVDNILVMSPEAYTYEWQAKTVRRQREWLRSRGQMVEGLSS